MRLPRKLKKNRKKAFKKVMNQDFMKIAYDFVLSHIQKAIGLRPIPRGLQQYPSGTAMIGENGPEVISHSETGKLILISTPKLQNREVGNYKQILDNQLNGSNKTR